MKIVTEQLAEALLEPLALVVEGVSFRFPGRLALDEVSLMIPPGEFTVLLGANGAGKTTLFSLITRLYNYRSGAVRIFGFDVRGQSAQALTRIGVVFQQPTLDLDLTVTQNLRYHAALQGLEGAEARRRINGELTRNGLAERATDVVRSLSGGQRRRVELARALLHRPRLLLLDEPTVGLDVHSRHDIIEHVRRLCQEQSVGVLWATHLIDEVQHTDNLVVLHHGRVRAAGQVAEVLAGTGANTVHEAFTQLTRREAS